MCCSHSFNCTMLCDVCIVCIWVALPNFNWAVQCSVHTHVYVLFSHIQWSYAVWCMYICIQAVPTFNWAMPINVCSVCICDFLPVWSSFMVHGLYECICAVHLHSMKPCHAMRMCVYVMSSHFFKLYCAMCVCMHTCCSHTFNQAVPCTGCMYIYIYMCCSPVGNWAMRFDLCMYVHMLFSCICLSCAVQSVLGVSVLFFCLQLSHAMWCVYVCIFAILLHLTKLCCWMRALYAHVLF